MFAQPGKKLIFMGGEFGQYREWSHDRSLDWHLLDHKMHRGLQRWMEDLNQFYRLQPAMHQGDFSRNGFTWIDCNDALQSTVSLLRMEIHGPQRIVAVCNFTPVPRYNYRVGVPRESVWHESLNSDSRHYGGSNQGNQGDVIASPVPYHGYEWSLNLVLPPLAIIFLTEQETG